MAQIDDFKAQLIGGGARSNQFRVTITPPAGIATGLDVRRASFLCKHHHYQPLPFQQLQFHFVVGTFMLRVTVLLMTMDNNILK